MFQRLFRWVYPTTPTSSYDATKTHKATIEALVGHLYQIGYPVREIRVPTFTVDADDYHYVTAYGNFRVVRGLDPYGKNVTTGKTASATVAADTIAAL